MTLQILLGSTRPGRNGESVAKWVADIAVMKDGVDVELVDIAKFNLPILDEPYPPAMGQPYTKEHTKIWSEKINEADAYIFVTPEYNHAVPGNFKNAIDYLSKEWANKVVGFVGYGALGAVRAIENWRVIASELQMADVKTEVLLTLSNDFENYSVFKPQPQQEQSLNLLLDQVILWSKGMKSIRN